MRYIPNTDQDRAQMLRAIGVSSSEELFDDIPAAVRLGRPLELPGAMAEQELVAHLQCLAERNADLDHYTCFLGAGVYDHFVPAVVGNLLSRGEFYTAYTPYQPEISQGTLQAIYEFQSLICELTGLDVANASLYDGASALAEAAIMAVNHTSRGEILVSRTVHPEARSVLRTYLAGQEVSIREIPLAEGLTDPGALEGMVGQETAAVVIQQPNFLGNLEPVRRLAQAAQAQGALFIVSADPISLGLLEAPGAYGADICVGEGQALGNRLSFGGPHLGFLAARSALVRRMPGRIAGATVDQQGRRGFVLTLQTREQHIRREKATSNICSNQALNALAAAIYLTTMGREGIREVAAQALAKAHYAHGRLGASKGFAPRFGAPFFREFALRTTLDPETVNHNLLQHRIIGGYLLGRDYPELADTLLIAFTEKQTRAQIDQLVARLEEMV
ncbi:MAG: aminomethyl-transferring glycine dehydrogenase subunit GcvPA [Actinobacteria bacterium]|nr:aminomethyl-transferring glycine dehydrogenase subunit GcvPA [Actinomycetota bacterium]